MEPIENFMFDAVSQWEMTRYQMAAADVSEFRFSGRVDADSGLVLGLIDGTPRGEAATGDRPLEIKDSPLPGLNVCGCTG